MTPAENIYELFVRFPRIVTDSRNVTMDSLFFAMKGEHFDGNLFAAEALEKGARFAVVDNPAVIAGKRYIQVPDTLVALQKLAQIHRSQIKATIIAITGSNGKTTTKELTGKILGSTFNTIMTRGNFNNHIGVPLTILSVTEDTSFAVVEMGANHPGEIASLCTIAQPHTGLITNVGKAHLEGFGSFEGVVKAKSELYNYLRQNKGLAFVNVDNPALNELTFGLNVYSYGAGQGANCQGMLLGNDPYLAIRWSSGSKSGTVKTMLCGDYNFENVMAAISIGLHFGITPEKIDQAVSSYNPDNNRSQVIQTSRNVIILDAYNANPSSMSAAIENFQAMAAPSKMLILGDMMELGSYSLAEHLTLVKRIREMNFDKIMLIGEWFSKAAVNESDPCFSNVMEAAQWLINNPVENMTVLLKGSRKMQLENLRDLL